MKPDHARALDILKSRDATWTVVHLRGGKACRVLNIACGHDLGEDVAHITSNISPEPSEPHAVDFFHANEILEIVDDESGGTLFLAERRG